MPMLHPSVIRSAILQSLSSPKVFQLYISPRHLQKLYQKRYGISCMEDVIKNRLILAREKLASTHLPIVVAEIFPLDRAVFNRRKGRVQNYRMGRHNASLSINSSHNQ